MIEEMSRLVRKDGVQDLPSKSGYIKPRAKRHSGPFSLARSKPDTGDGKLSHPPDKGIK
jgi:hypothetical protein